MRGCESFDRGSPKRAYTNVQMDFSLKVVARMQFGKHGVNRAQNSHNVLKKKNVCHYSTTRIVRNFQKSIKIAQEDNIYLFETRYLF